MPGNQVNPDEPAGGVIVRVSLVVIDHVEKLLRLRRETPPERDDPQ